VLNITSPLVAMVLVSPTLVVPSYSSTDVNKSLAEKALAGSVLSVEAPASNPSLLLSTQAVKVKAVTLTSLASPAAKLKPLTSTVEPFTQVWAAGVEAKVTVKLEEITDIELPTKSDEGTTSVIASPVLASLNIQLETSRSALTVSEPLVFSLVFSISTRI